MCRSTRHGWSDWLAMEKEVLSKLMQGQVFLLNFDLKTLTFDFQGQIWKSLYFRKSFCVIDVKWNGCKSIGSWADCVTLTIDHWLHLRPWPRIFSSSKNTSVPLSICLSVRLRPSVTPFSLCSCHHIIMKFSWVINIDWWTGSWMDQIDGLVQDCSNSIANALELLQSCTKPSR